MDKEKRDIRIVFIIFSGISCFLAYKSYPSLISFALIFISGVLLLSLAFSPLILKPVFNVWLRIAHVIGRVNTHILLFLIFVFIFMPVGLLMRLFGKDPMQRKIKEETYWEPYEVAGIKDKSRYERQF